MEFESVLEYQHWILLETNPDIISLCEQFPRVKGVDHGKRFTYQIILIVSKYTLYTCVCGNDMRINLPNDDNRV